MSNRNQVKFLWLAAKAYKGINSQTKTNVQYPADFEFNQEMFKNVDPDKGVVIVFPDGYPYTQLEADQGRGKTSLLAAIQEMCGGEGNPNSINTEENSRDVKSRFWGKDGKLYHLSITRSGVQLDEVLTGEDGEPLVDAKGKEQKREVKSAKARLAELVGPAGMSPLWLQNKDGKEQVQWIRSLYVPDQEVIKLELEVNSKLNKAFNERTDVGREKSLYTNALDTNDYYIHREQWQKYFDETSYDDVENDMEAIKTAYKEYQSNENGLSNLRTDLGLKKEHLRDIEQEILDLEAKLVLAKKNQANKQDDIKVVEGRIKKGEKWIKDNVEAKTKYDNLSEKVREASEFKMQKQGYDQMMEQLRKKEHAESEYLRLSGMVDEYRKAKREFIASFTPAVPGLEVCTPDEEDPREGLFYNGKPFKLLAESELWQVCGQLWQKLNIKIIIVENINSLGSGAIEVFNEFTKSGGLIFGSMMNREEKNLKISFNTKVS